MKLNIHKFVIVSGVLGLTALSAFGGFYDSWRIKLESNDYHWRLMHMPTNRPIRLVKKLSKAPCDYGKSWGITDRGIWVDRGCRAIFQVAGPRPNHWRIVWEMNRHDGDRDHDWRDWHDNDFENWH